MPLIDSKNLFLFDFDGTLVDSDRGLCTSINYMRAQYSLKSLSIEELRRHVGRGQLNLVQGCLAGAENADANEGLEIFSAHYRSHVLDDIGWYPGAEEALKKLISLGKTCAIVSNKNMEFIEIVLTGMNSKKYFSLVLGGDSGYEKKPSPDLALQACRQLGHHPEKTILLGDSPFDVKCAQAAEITAAACAWGFHARHELDVLKPDVILDSFDQLFNI